ncbi:MAG: damage-inducible protein DinB, partial [Hymenobacter sp.]
MKKIAFFATFLLLLGLVTFAQAQSVDETVKEWERARVYTK